MTSSLTIKSVAVRRPRRRLKQAPLTAHQRALKAATRAQRQSTLDEAVGEWYSATLIKAEQLAKKFDKKPHFFLELFFQGGARMVQKRKKVNPWNAWISLQAEIANAGNVALSEIFLIYSCTSRDQCRRSLSSHRSSTRYKGRIRGSIEGGKGSHG